MPTLKEMKAITEAATNGDYVRASTIVRPKGTEIDLRIGRGYKNWLTIKTSNAEADAVFIALANPARFLAILELLEEVAPFMREGLGMCDEPQCSFCNTALDVLAKLAALEKMP